MKAYGALAAFLFATVGVLCSYGCGGCSSAIVVAIPDDVAADGDLGSARREPQLEAWGGTEIVDAFETVPAEAAEESEEDLCLPVTCDELGVGCGDVPDGCGNRVSCGNCGTDMVCKEGKCFEKDCTIELLDSFGGEAWDVAVAGDIAYVGLGLGGTYAFDVSNALEPKLVGRLRLPGETLGVTLAQGYVLASAFEQGLQVVDASDPLNMKVAGQLPLPGLVRSVKIVGSTGYVAAGKEGMYVLDLTSLTAPTVVGHWSYPGPSGYSTSYSSREVDVFGNIALVAHYFGGLLAVDVSNPANPVTSQIINHPGYVMAVRIASTHAYVSVSDTGSGDPDAIDGVGVYDLSSPGNIVQDGWLAVPGTPDGLTVDGQRLLIAAREAGLLIAEIGDTGALDLVAELPLSGEARKVAVSGDVALVTTSGVGLELVDLSDPSAPAPLGKYHAPGNVWNVEKASNVLYATDGWGGLLMLDVSDPSKMIPVGRSGSDAFARALDVEGTLAVVGEWTLPTGHLLTVDVSEPEAPKLVGTLPVEGQCRGVDVADDVAYLAQDAYLRGVDISNPALPETLWTDEFGVSANDVQVVGKHAFVAAGYDGLAVCDVHKKHAKPELAAMLDLDCNAAALHVVDGLAYVACGNAGIRIVDVSEPADPVPLGKLALVGSAEDVFYYGFLFVAANTSGVIVVDVADPSSPDVTGIFDTPGKAKAIFVSGTEAYVACYEGGIAVISVTECW